MCGIVGYIGDNHAQPILLGGLRRLEYRGYDSAGVITAGVKGATLLRKKGKVAELDAAVAKKPMFDTVGIGHTRWATHGEPNERNAHPHKAGDIYLVHNGIIENYMDLRTVLKKRGYEFISDTDTEVLAALIDSVYQAQSGAKNLHRAVDDALNMAVGAYGIAVMAAGNLDEVVVAKKGSPLVLGIGDGEVFIASDPSALVGHTDRVVYLRDNEVATCRRSGIDITDATATPIDAQVEILEMDIQAIQKKGYDHFLLKEIFEQPDTLRATLSGRVLKKENEVRLGGINMTPAQLKRIKHVFIVACGTASYAGMLASYYYETLMDDITVEVAIASELRYRSFNVPDHSVAAFVSQSGETADTLACLEEMKRRGVRCIGIINSVGSSIARAVDGGVYLHAGAEISVASTKAYTSQATALIMFGLVIAQAKGLSPQVLRDYVRELDALPDEIHATLISKNDEIKKLVKKYQHYEHAFYIGRDVMYPLAMEGALKLKETSYIHVEGQAAGELKHGSIALVDDRFFEVAFVADNWLYEKTMSNVIEMRARGGHIITITDSRKDIETETVVRVHTSIKVLTPLVFNIVSQLFAYHMAVARGNDVDQPRNLAKSVTVE